MFEMSKYSYQIINTGFPKLHFDLRSNNGTNNAKWPHFLIYEHIIMFEAGVYNTGVPEFRFKPGVRVLGDHFLDPPNLSRTGEIIFRGGVGKSWSLNLPIMYYIIDFMWNVFITHWENKIILFIDNAANFQLEMGFIICKNKPKESSSWLIFFTIFGAILVKNGQIYVYFLHHMVKIPLFWRKNIWRFGARSSHSSVIAKM